jgi:CRISPR/Cas system-associated protein Cas10 (large subunit of type III CRISPR-Cas system)
MSVTLRDLEKRIDELEKVSVRAIAGVALDLKERVEALETESVQQRIKREGFSESEAQEIIDSEPEEWECTKCHKMSADVVGFHEEYGGSLLCEVCRTGPESAEDEAGESPADPIRAKG